jgi:hypothetical protein
MLFNSVKLAGLVQYERDHGNMPIDDNIRDFVKENPITRPVFAMVPNAFEHVGRFSSNPEKSTGAIEHRSIRFDP